MVDKKFCDICNDEIETAAIGYWSRCNTKGETIEKTEIEICSECSKKIEAYIEQLKVKA